ncbi:MAG TPA: HEAT repeat domain-containing protein, partial [Phycisphaerae bacterium]|nr:HEAT repeat domain-containing protein [Phycisphaerae bacterium]
MRHGLAILAAGVMLAGGCGGKNPSLDEWVKTKLLPMPTSAKVVLVQSHLPDERREALQAITKDRKALKEESVIVLFCLVAVTDDDPLVRGAAVRGMAKMENQGVRIAAPESSGETTLQKLLKNYPGADANGDGKLDVLETLSYAAVNDTDRHVRADAVEALGCRVPPEGMPAVVKALQNDTSPDVRIKSAETLGQFRDTDAAQTLVAMLNDRNLAVGQKAWESLRYMTGQDLARTPEVWTEYFASAEQPFARYGKAPKLPKGENRRP